jgi:SAM-dependent methyltransferase
MRADLRHLATVFSTGVTRFGAMPAAVGWPNADDLAKRFEVLLSPLDLAHHRSDRPLRLLDLGCGPGLLLDYLAVNNLLDRIEYLGIDIVEESLNIARTRWPRYRFEQRDVRDTPFERETFEYCVICGVFTGRPGISYLDMVRMVCETLSAVWPAVRLGLGFNVMSKHVDWEREDLFHWPLDDLMTYCKASLSRHVSLRLDYGLWEVSALVRKEPVATCSEVPERWAVSTPSVQSVDREMLWHAAISRENYELAVAAHLAREAATLDTLRSEIRKETDAATAMRLQVKEAILSSGLFDREFYLQKYLDVLAIRIDPLDHYISHGEPEGRLPNTAFSPHEYQTTYSVPPQRSALQHYIEHGERAGYDASPSFNPRTYLETNPELQAFVDRPLFHFIKLGMKAGFTAASRKVDLNSSS